MESERDRDLDCGSHVDEHSRCSPLHGLIVSQRSWIAPSVHFGKLKCLFVLPSRASRVTVMRGKEGAEDQYRGSSVESSQGGIFELGIIVTTVALKMLVTIQ
jgi:hypothetical protein